MSNEATNCLSVCLASGNAHRAGERENGKMTRGRGGSVSGRGRSKTGGSKKYPRVARVNESLREVIAEEIEQIDDDRLFLCTITGINVDPDLRHATVFFSVIDPSATDRAADTKLALEEHRSFLQKAVGRELILKRTPLLTFEADSGVANGAKIEAIISVMPRSPEGIDYGVDEDGIGGPPRSSAARDEDEEEDDDDDALSTDPGPLGGPK